MSKLIELLTKKLNLLKLLKALYERLFGKKKKELHIIDLARVMARFEGYYIENSRARRNRNPLNLKWSKFATGYDSDSFCIFPTSYDGWKACLWDLEKKCKGYTRTGLKPTSTVKELIYVWSATDQAPYAFYVCKRLKIPQDYQLQNFSLKQIYLTLRERFSELERG